MENIKKWLGRTSVRIGLIVIVAIALLFVLVKNSGEKMQVSQNDDLIKAIGIQGTSPKKLSSYEQVTGVLDIQHWVTAKGVRVYFVEVPALPMVDIEISFDAGAARNGKFGGVSYLTNQMLADGATNLTADQIAENFDNVGAQFNVEAQRDMAKADLRSLSDPKQLMPALQTLKALLSKPTFPDQEFKRQQQLALTLLKQQSQTPQQIASKTFYSALYNQQPYSQWVLGDETSIKSITTADLKAFHNQYYVAQNAVVTIVGAVTASDADAIAQMLTNDLPQGVKAAALTPVTDLKQGGLLKKVNFPSAQTHILIGEPGVKQGDPDYYALYVGNHILGGGSVARLFNTVRNQHGLAYSVYSYFIPMRERGPFILGCQTRNDQADKALDLIQKSLVEFVEKGPTKEELTEAKQNLLGGYPLQFDSNASICTQVAALGFYGLPLDYFNEFKPKIEKVTINDIKEAFQKRIKPNDMIVVMVGGVAEPKAAKANG